jgi:AraC-like DNA-binding protein
VEIDITEVKMWIFSHPESVGNSKDVGLRFNVDVESLRREFIKHEGVSLAQFIKIQKFSVARGLLCTTNLRWKEIVGRLNLGRPENASRAFKREIGLRVREYRDTVERPAIFPRVIGQEMVPSGNGK